MEPVEFKNLKEHIKPNLTFEEKAGLLMAVINHITDPEDETVFDFSNPGDIAFLSSLYGSQALPRWKGEGVKYLIAGNYYYANGLDKTEIRINPVVVLTPNNIDFHLNEWLDDFEETINDEAGFYQSKTEFESNLNYLDDVCGGLIDFRKALEGQEKFSVTINVTAKDLTDALKKAYKEIRMMIEENQRMIEEKGHGSVVVEKED